MREWVAANFTPRKTINPRINDEMMRRLFQGIQGGSLLSEEEYVGHMRASGFMGRKTRYGDWVFNISEKDYGRALLSKWRGRER